MTRAQARALADAATAFVVDDITPLPGAHLGIEIGFGMGHGLLHWAAQSPQWQLYGIELYQPGIGALLNGLVKAQLTNVRILEAPAQLALHNLLTRREGFGAEARIIDEVRIQFPDPWPKKRHHKRRLIQADFLALLAQVVKPDGVVKLATDWQPYADWMREHFGASTRFRISHERIGRLHESDLGALHEGQERVTTKFERRGDRLGHDIHELHYVVI